VQSLTYVCEYPLFTEPFFEKAMFSPVCYFCSFGIFIKNQLGVDVCVIFWGLCSVPWVYVSVFMSTPCCFSAYCSVMCFETRYCNASCFISFAQDCSGYSDLSSFSMNFRMLLVFGGDCTESTLLWVGQTF
jgi:hypothetical protein